jgi:hypothetical protein
MRRRPIALIVVASIVVVLGFQLLRRPRDAPAPAPAPAMTLEQARELAGFPVRQPTYLPAGAKLATVRFSEQPPLPPPPPPKVDPAILAGTATKVGIGVLIGQHPKGWRISSLEPDGPSERAGVEKGEIITAIEGRSATRFGIRELRSAFERTPGTTVMLDLWRDGRSRTVAVTTARYRLHPQPVKEPSRDPIQTVVLQYRMGAHEFLLFAGQERGELLPVGGRQMAVDIEGASGILAVGADGARNSLMWSEGGVAYHLSDYKGQLAPEEMERIAESIEE